MRVLVACEFSGIVRDAFAARGHDAWSCDLLPTERPGQHIQADVRTLRVKFDHAAWDMLIAFPPCTYLCSSGARWWAEHQHEQSLAIRFVEWLWSLPMHKAIENPIGCLSTRWMKPNQIIHPWQFGHGETKATCLWLDRLPPLRPTKIVDGRQARVHMTPQRKDRWKDRSRTLPGIAEAMAEQWGAHWTRG